MADMLPITVPVEIDVSKAMPSLNEVKSGVDKLKTALDVLKNSNQDSIIPGFVRDMDEQISITQENIDHLLNQRKRVDSSITDSDRKINLQNFQTAYNRAIKSVLDLANGLRASQDLGSMIAKDIHTTFSSAMKPAAAQIKSTFSAFASNISKTMGNQDQASLMKMFLGGTDLQKVLSKNNISTGARGLSEAALAKYVEAIFPTAVSQMNNRKYIDWSDFSKSGPQTIKERLPEKFRQLPLSRNPIRQTMTKDSPFLTQQESKKIQDYLLAHPYVMREAEQAGLVRRHNGSIFWNRESTRAHVNAFGGNVLGMFESGVRGGPSSGILSIEDENDLTPRQRTSARNKNNAYTINSEHAAKFLAENFGWMQPTYTKDQKTKKFIRPQGTKEDTWENIGRMHGAVRQDAMDFFAVQFSDINNGTINIPRNEDHTPTGKSYIRVNRSMMQNILSAQKGADKFMHNGLNTNEVYVRLPVEELSDYETTQERKDEIRKTILNTIKSPQKIAGMEDLGEYVFSGLTGTHMVLTRKTIKDQIENNPKTRNFFRNGEARTTFDSYEDFARSMAYSKLLRTEGESVEDLWGVDPKDLKVVVANMRDIKDENGNKIMLTGNDGMRIVDSKIFPESFQHRDFGGKGTSSVYNMDEIRKRYSRFIAQEDNAKEGIHKGDLVFPRGGWDGGKLVIPEGTTILEDASLLKTKKQYDGMSQKAINKARTDSYRSFPMLAKTTAEGFQTDVSYIPAQEASTLQLTKNAKDYFRDVGLKTLKSLNNPETVKRLLFSGEDSLSKLVMEDEAALLGEPAQERIMDFRRKVSNLMRGGNLVLPQGVAQYAMIQSWAPDIFNSLIGNANLTDEERAMSLRAKGYNKDMSVDDTIAYFAQADSDLIQMFRNPSTSEGNILAANAAIDKYFQDLGTALGVDKNALYLDPSSEILKRMQTADEDGDTVFAAALRNNPEFREIMLPVLAATADRYKRIKELSGFTDEEQEARIALRTSKLVEDTGKTYSSDNSEDITEYIMNLFARNGKMGLSHSIALGARQFELSETTARALRDVNGHYDNVSNTGFKSNTDFKPTSEEWKVAAKGSPFYRLYEWARKATSVEPDEDGRLRSTFDYDAFARHNIDKVNFATLLDDNAILADEENYLMHQLYPDADEANFDWDTIFEEVNKRKPIDTNTAAGKFQAAMRQLQKSRLKGEWLALDDEGINRMATLGVNAFKEISKQVENESKNGTFNGNIQEEALRRYHSIGGQALDLELKHGWTSAFRNEDQDALEELVSIMSAAGTDNPFYNAAEIEKAETQWEKEKQDAQKRLQEAQQKQEELQKKFRLSNKKIKGRKHQKQSSIVTQSNKPRYGPDSVETPEEIANKEALAAAEAEVAEAQAVVQQYEDNSAALTKISETMRVTDDLIKNIYVSKKKKENKLNDIGAAESYFSKNYGITKGAIKAIDEDISDANVGTKAVFEKDIAGQDLRNALVERKRTLAQNLYEDFFDFAELQAKNAIESIEELLDKEVNKPSKQKQTLDAQTKELEELKKTRALVLNQGNNPLGDLYNPNTVIGNGKTLGMLQEQTADDLGFAIKEKAAQIAELTKVYTEENEASFEDSLNELANKIDPRIAKNSPEVLSAQRMKKINKAKETLEHYHKENLYSDARYDEHMRRLADLERMSSVDAIAEQQSQQRYVTELQDNTRYNQLLRQRASLMRGMYGGGRSFGGRILSQRDSYISAFENRKIALEREINSESIKLQGIDQNVDPRRYQETAEKIGVLKQQSQEASKAIEALSSPMGTASMMAVQLGQNVERLAQRFGRQLFQKALQETKRFIREFDASMNEIQAITLKSDSDMQGIRSQTIGKAIGLRTSVSNVAGVEAALYRQGLSDAEVSSRTDSIIKFATVTKLNVTEATKIITTALQNDLVPSAEAAMDALVALGDSAATTAAEIGKGMQKAAASAKVAGVSYAELTSLLTIGTSDTQLSGTQVGTALQTVFTRMRRLSLSGYTADQNGKKTSASDAEAALKAVGVSLYDDKTLGRMRNAFDIMRDLAKVWQSLNDTQKSIVTGALAGTRQTNIFSTLMEGMSEDNGETLEKYLGLAEGSEGVTQTKYEIAMQSLTAAMDELRSSWDAVVESFTNSGMITGVLDYLSDFLQMIAGAGNIGQGFSVIIGGITGIAAALLAISSGNPVLAALSSIIGVIAGISTAGGIAKISSLFNSPEIKGYEQQLEKDNSHISDYNKAIEQQKELISNVEKYGEAWQKANNIENEDNLKNALNNLKIAFPELSGEIEKAIANLSQWKDIVDAAKDSSDNFAGGRKDNIAKDFASYVSAYGETITDEIYGKYFTNQVAQQEAREKFEYYKASNGYTTPLDLYRHTASGASNAFNDYVDSILKARGINGDEIRNGTIERNDPRLYKEINSLLEMGLYSETSKETNAAFAIKQNKEQVDKFWDGLITNNGEINERIYNKTGTDKLKYQLLSTLFGNSADLREEIEESNPDLYRALLSVGEGYGYGTYYGAITEGANEDEFRMAAEFMDKLVNRQSELGNAAARKRASNEAIEKMIADRDLSTFVTENVSEDVFKAALKTSIGKAIDADYEKYHIGNEYNWEAIGNLINEILSEATTSDQVAKFAEENASDLYYKYKVGEQGYVDLSSARKAVSESNGKYSLADIRNYKDDTIVYPSVDQLVSANRQEANANNRRITINDILNGYNNVSGFHLMTDEQRREYLKGKPQDYYRELSTGNLAPALSKIGSIDELKRIYSGDLAPVLNNVITGNGVAAAAMLLGDIDLFRQALANEDNGITVPESDMMESVINALRTNKDFVGLFRTDEYLSGARDKFASFFGSNSELILNALANGTYDSDDALKAYVTSVLASRKIKTGTGLRQFTNVETAKLAEQVLGIGSWTEAQAKSNELGWTTDEWSVIESKYPDLKRYLLMSDKQKTSQEGQNILRDVKIQMSVAGVSDLENANKVLEGTTQLIENLQKGGTIEFKAKLDFENQLYSNQQQEALLENGTYEEQIEAIMALTGRSKTQVQNDFIGSKNSARSVVAGQRAQTATSLIELQKTDPELAARLASMFGFSNNGLGMSIDDALDEINKFFGYEGDDKYQYNAATDELYRYGNGMFGGRYRFVASSAARERFEKNIGVYNYTGSAGQPDRETINLKQAYSASQIANAQKTLLEGGTIDDYDLYQQAISSLTDSQRDFLALRQAADRGETIDRRRYEKAQRLANKDTDRIITQAKEQDELAEAEIMASTSAYDAERYANLYSRQQNKAGYAADALYNSLTALRSSDEYGVNDIKNIFTENGLANWEELLKSAPDLTEAFKDMGHAVKEDGTIDWSAIEEEAGGLDQALADLISIIASYSANFQNVDYKTRSEIFTNASKYDPTSASGFYNDYASIVGQDIAARRAGGDLTPIDQEYADLLMSNYEKGINGLTKNQQIQGTENLYNSIIDGTYKDTYGKASQDVINAYSGSVQGLQELIEEYNKGNIETEEFAKRTKDVGAALNAAKFSAENYGETVDETSKYIENLSAGGTKAIKTVGQLRTRMSQLNNVAESIKKARGNSGKSLTSEQRSDLASVTGESEAAIKEMTAEEISKLADNAQQIIDEEFTGTIAPTIQEELNRVLSENHVTGKMLVDMGVDVGDGLDTSEIAAIAAQFNEDALATLASYAGKIGELVYEMTGDKDSVNLITKLIRSSVSGSGSRVGGGGGGGGKSAVDKLLEDQKHNIAAIEHENKMLDIDKKHQDIMNDYSGYNSTVDKQIELQNRLRDTYAANIAEMEAMLAKTKENSDDWWKLKDAINAAEEAMKSVHNTIHELNSERSNQLNQVQEIQDKPNAHAATMLQKMAQRYQTLGDQDNYRAIMQQNIDVYRKQIEMNDDQIKEQEALLATFVEGSDEWIAVRDKIWEIKAENADLENEILNSELEIQNSRLSQITDTFEKETASLDHNVNMLSTYADLYQRNGDYGTSQEMLRGIASQNTVKLGSVKETIELLKQEMNSLEEGSVAWYNARNALFQYEEMEAQLTATIYEKNQALAESKVQEITEKLSDSTKHLTHEIDMLTAAGDEYQKEGMLANYQDTLTQRTEKANSVLEEQTKALEEMKEALNDPEITGEAYDLLVDNIEETESAIQSTTNSIKELNREINKNALAMLTEAFEYGGEGYEGGDVENQHNIQMLQYQETKYQNKGELTNYGKMLRQETDLQRGRARNIQNYIKELEDYKETIKDDDEAVKDIDASIFKWEEELEKLNVTINKNEKALSDNEKQILKIRSNIEKQIDQEIRRRIQEEKDKLAAVVSVENTILDTIRKNAQEEWRLEKETIQKKKEALNEEKNLLNQRVQARKDALNEENKYEELARINQQLALIQADSTRTKETQELLKKKKELEQEIAWDIVNEQTAATQKMYDDEIKAWDDYAATHEEELNAYLENTNNFRETLDQILNGSVDDFIDYMRKHSKDYKNSTAEMQEQMEQGWTDTFRKSKGEIQKYWDEVDEVMRSREGFIEYMKNSTQYETASATEQALLERDFGEMYDAVVNAEKDDAMYEHTHAITNKIDDLMDNTFTVTFDTKRNTVLNYLYKLYDVFEVLSNEIQDYDPYDNYEGVGKAIDEPYTGGGSTNSAAKPSGNNGSPAATSSTNQNTRPASGWYEVNSTNTNSGISSGFQDLVSGGLAKIIHTVIGKTIDEFEPSVISTNNRTGLDNESTSGLNINALNGLTRDFTTTTKTSGITSVSAKEAAKENKGYSYDLSDMHGPAKEGALVDFTGPAWVDGTMQNPESFLDATDTKLLRSLLDTFDYISTPYMSNIDTSRYGNDVSIGDVNVTINEAQINKDQDIADLAKKIGSAFTKELTKSGLNNAAYAW